MKFRWIYKYIAILILGFLVFGCSLNSYASDGEKFRAQLGTGDKNDGIMQYNARPIVQSIGLINVKKDLIAIDYSKSMMVASEQGIDRLSNFEISIDSGQTFSPVSKFKVSTIATLNGNKRTVICFSESLSVDTSKIVVKVLRVADSSKKDTLQEFTLVKLENYEVNGNGISDVVVVNPKLITFSTSFQIQWISSWLITYNAGTEITVKSVDYTNSETGAAVDVHLSQAISSDADIKTLKFLNFDRGAIIDSMGVYNLSPIRIETGKIVDGIAPKMIDSYTRDIDADGHIDEISVTYNEDVRISVSDFSEINVYQYKVNSIRVDGRQVIVGLVESKAFDTGARPFVQFYGNVTDLAGNVPSQDELGIMVKDGAKPVVREVEIISGGKKKGFGNDLEDTLAIRFSEPVFTTFEDGKNPTYSELGSIFGYIENGKMEDVFDAGAYVAKNLSVYPSDQLAIMLTGGIMQHPMKTGGLLRIVESEYLKDASGLAISAGQPLVRIK